MRQLWFIVISVINAHINAYVCSDNHYTIVDFVYFKIFIIQGEFCKI